MRIESSYRNLLALTRINSAYTMHLAILAQLLTAALALAAPGGSALEDNSLDKPVGNPAGKAAGKPVANPVGSQPLAKQVAKPVANQGGKSANGIPPGFLKPVPIKPLVFTPTGSKAGGKAQPDAELDCARVRIICHKIYMNKEMENGENDLAAYCGDVRERIEDDAEESHNDGSNCLNGEPYVDPGQPTCTVAANYGWGLRYEAEFVIRRFRKTCNDPPTGAGRLTKTLTEICGVVKQDFSSWGTASVDNSNVHCGE
ncbi:hypothetical protein CKM354_001030100 [Cercospora kikuchii]|uniref:Uncharacterized protein n=1 Tax=Cercospora kikuchii TaxID=84275 RepID=A0A9P3CPY8_9PEZI|nr:uncharacterized protein CKM354_001030100 [Cercospora kikuchii]GIZ47202.1 hypothetical protein CKM354_001030100 [Cercospora kikuchii]